MFEIKFRGIGFITLNFVYTLAMKLHKLDANFSIASTSFIFYTVKVSP